MEQEERVHVPQVTRLAFTTNDKSEHAQARKHQVYRDHVRRITKVADMRTDPRTKIDRLYKLKEQYMEGYPHAKGSRADIRVDGVPVLARVAEALADRYIKIEMLKTKKKQDKQVDVGKVSDDQEGSAG